MMGTTSILNRIGDQYIDTVNDLVNEFSEITLEILSNYGYLQEAETEEEILELTEFSTLVALNVIADILEETDYIPDFVLADIFEQTAAIMPAENVKVRLRDRLKYYIQGLKQRLKEKISAKKQRIADFLGARKRSIKRLIAAKFGYKLGALGEKLVGLGSSLKKYSRARQVIDIINRTKEGESQYSRALTQLKQTPGVGPEKQQMIAKINERIRQQRNLRERGESLLKKMGF